MLQSQKPPNDSPRWRTSGGYSAPRFSRRYWLRLAVFSVAASTVAGLFLLVYFIHAQVNAFVTPYRNTHIDPSPLLTLNIPFEEISLTTADGLKISGWYIPGRRPQAIILAHGVDANRMAVLPEAVVLAEAGYHLLLLDLRGHGRSEGSEVTYGYREAWDIQAALNYLLVRPEIEQVGALGTSLGGATVARAAAIEPRLEAVVIESSYSSLPDAVEDAFDSLSIFPKWPFAPLLVSLAERRVNLKISQVDVARDLASIHPRPVLIIHGTEDTLFPPHHAQKLYHAAQEPKTLWLIEDLGHSNPVIGREAAFKARVLTFFDQAFSNVSSQ